MKFSKFTELVARIWSNTTTQRRDPEITIVVHSPGSIGPSPSVEVEATHCRDCGEEIPERRRELVAGCQRCADCQEEEELRGKHRR